MSCASSRWLEMQLDKLDQTILSWKDDLLKPKEPEQIIKKTSFHQLLIVERLNNGVVLTGWMLSEGAR